MSDTVEVKAAKARTINMNHGATITIDPEDNTVQVPGYPYILESLGDKVLLAMDRYLSGYECKTCKGVGRIKSQCACESTDRPGFKYDTATMENFDDPNIIEARSTMVCTKCFGHYLSKRKDDPCPDCLGKGGLLVVPESSKTLPTTGVVVSVGPDVKDKRIKPGVRLLTGAYVGTMVPIKGGVLRFKCIREHESQLMISGGEELAAFDFIEVEADASGMQTY